MLILIMFLIIWFKFKIDIFLLLYNWSSPAVLPIVQFIINSSKNSETGYSPFQLQYANLDNSYFKFPSYDSMSTDVYSNDFISELSNNFNSIRSSSYSYQMKLKNERNSKFSKHANFQSGDLVFILGDKSDRKTKLHGRNIGPFKVIEHSSNSNDVRIQSLISGKERVVFVSSLMYFAGTQEEAITLACSDDDQVSIELILGYKGDHERRTTCEFLVKFSDGDIIWKRYDTDLATTYQFELFCNSISHMKMLLNTNETNNQLLSTLNKQPITSIKKDDIVYITLRIIGSHAYDQLLLPDIYTTNYVTRAVYGNYKKKDQSDIYITFLDFMIPKKLVTNWFILFYGSSRELNPGAVLVTHKMIEETHSPLSLKGGSVVHAHK